MITKRNGNGQTECYGCKQKGKFALKWDNWLYDYNDNPYCLDCLMEMLEKMYQENKELQLELSGYRQAILNDRQMLGIKEQNKKYKEVIDKAISLLEDDNICADIRRFKPKENENKYGVERELLDILKEVE